MESWEFVKRNRHYFMLSIVKWVVFRARQGVAPGRLGTTQFAEVIPMCFGHF